MDERHDDDSERDQAGVEPQVDRRKKHEAQQVAAGFTRCIVRCHKDDMAKIKAYAATLLKQRRTSI